jgi:hypothetical protein
VNNESDAWWYEMGRVDERIMVDELLGEALSVLADARTVERIRVYREKTAELRAGRDRAFAVLCKADRRAGAL